MSHVPLCTSRFVFFLQDCKAEPAVPELHCSYPEEPVDFTHSAALHCLRAVRLLVEAE